MNGAMSVCCLKDGLKEVQERLNAQKKLLKGCNREIGEAHAEKSQLVKDMNNMQLQVQELEHKVSKCNKDSNDAAKLVCDLFMAALWNRAGHYIFALWFLSSSIYLSIFFSLA